MLTSRDDQASCGFPLEATGLAASHGVSQILASDLAFPGAGAGAGSWQGWQPPVRARVCCFYRVAAGRWPGWPPSWRAAGSRRGGKSPTARDANTAMAAALPRERTWTERAITAYCGSTRNCRASASGAVSIAA